MTRPVRTTVLYALISGFAAVPSALLLNMVMPWSIAFKLTVWAVLALYVALLARWSGTGLRSVCFPLIILLGASLWPLAGTGFFILSLAMFGWIRSGICFQGVSAIRLLIAETITAVGGAALVALLSSHSYAALALNICLFFLIQTLYFFGVSLPGQSYDASQQADPFEQAAADAKKIMDGI